MRLAWTRLIWFGRHLRAFEAWITVHAFFMPLLPAAEDKPTLLNA